MASSLSKRLCQSLIKNPIKPSQVSLRFCTNISSSDWDVSNLDIEQPDSDPAPPSSPSPDNDNAGQRQVFFDRPLQDGLDVGVYKAIMVGQVGQNPIEKRLRSGRTITLLSLGTGGIRNNRRPFANEDPKAYANRSMVQWHRVSIYAEKLGAVALKHVVPGTILYLEGNLETKIFTDPITGLARRVREIAIRQNGRMVFLGNGGDAEQLRQADLKGVGYY